MKITRDVIPRYLILQGEQKKFSASARQRAIKYLERNLPKIKDPYELAITTYALAVTGSAEADFAYSLLKAIQKEEGGMVYWGRSDIKTNDVRYEFNRPFLQAKAYQDDDALAVEATGEISFKKLVRRRKFRPLVGLTLYSVPPDNFLVSGPLTGL